MLTVHFSYERLLALFQGGGVAQHETAEAAAHLAQCKLYKGGQILWVDSIGSLGLSHGNISLLCVPRHSMQTSEVALGPRIRQEVGTKTAQQDGIDGTGRIPKHVAVA